MSEINKDTAKNLSAEFADLFKDIETQTDNETKALASVQILANSIEIALSVNQPEKIASLKTEKLPQIVTILGESAEKIFSLYRGILKNLPLEAVEGLMVKLKLAKEIFVSDLAADEKDIRLYVEEMAETQREKLEKELELARKIAENDQMFKTMRDMEDALRIYAESNHRAVNSLPRRLNEAKARLEMVEKILGEVDGEIKILLEEHQRHSDIMQIVQNQN